MMYARHCHAWMAVWTVLAVAGSEGSQAAATADAHAGAPERPTAADWRGMRPVGIWMDGRVDGFNVPAGCVNAPRDPDAFRAYYRAAFTDIRAKGIDLVVIPNTPNAHYRGMLLAEAERTDVKVVLEIAEFVEFIRGGRTDEAESEELVRGVVAECRDSPGLFAYQLIDEPSAELFPGVRLVARLLRKHDPAHPPFSALCVEGSVRRFVEEVPAPAVVFDRYTLGVAPDEEQFVQLERTVRAVKEAAGTTPVWFVIQTFGIPDRLRLPSAAEIRREIDIAIDGGCTGIFLFLYNSDTQTERLQGLVRRDGASTDAWDKFPDLVAYARDRLREGPRSR